MANKKEVLALGILFFSFLVIISFSSAGTMNQGIEKSFSEDSDEEISVIISFKEPSVPSNVEDLVNEKAKIGYEHKIINSISAKVPSNAIKKISQKPYVESIEPDYEVEALLDESVPEIGADIVWNYNLSGQGVDVAVLDTGISNHDSLSLSGSVDFTGEGLEDLHGHGTHVAGIIASNDDLYRGVSPNVLLYNVKVLNKEGSGLSSDIIKGIEWAVENDIEIISLSLGANLENCDGTDALSKAVDRAVEEGTFAVVAAGNLGPEEGTITSPGCAKRAITVGATNGNEVASFSSSGPTADGRIKPDFVSPGVRIKSTWVNNGFNSLSGTSMAVPHLSGTIALFLEYNESLSLDDLKNVLTEGADDLGLEKNRQGEGKLNISRSYKILSGKNISGEIILEESNETEEINESEEEEFFEGLNNTEEGNSSDSFSEPKKDFELEKGRDPRKPGYGLFKAIERIKLKLSFNEEKKTALGLRFAERRLSEALGVIEEDPELSDELLREYESGISDLEKEINESEKRNWSSMKEKIAERKNFHQKVLEESLESVPVQAKPSIERAINNSKRSFNLEEKKTDLKIEKNSSKELEEKTEKDFNEKKEEIQNQSKDEISNKKSPLKEVNSEEFPKEEREEEIIEEKQDRNSFFEKLKRPEISNPGKSRGITGKIVNWIFGN